MGWYQTKVRADGTVKQQKQPWERRGGTGHTVEQPSAAAQSLLQEFLQLQTEIQFFYVDKLQRK